MDSEERKLREEKKREQMIEISEDVEKWKVKDCNGNDSSSPQEGAETPDPSEMKPVQAANKILNSTFSTIL